MKFIKNTFSAVLAGIMISIGGTVYLSCDNRYIGAVLFCFGLFMIICFRFMLFTGKAGYIPLNKPSYIFDVLASLIGNALGVFVSALCIRQTAVSAVITEKAAGIAELKISDSLKSAFILAVFCGLLMFSAVESNRIYTERKNYTGAVFGVFLPVVVFIICGFNHSIADMFYLFLSGTYRGIIPYLIVVITGNAAGGMLIPAVQKFIIKPEN